MKEENPYLQYALDDLATEAAYLLEALATLVGREKIVLMTPLDHEEGPHLICQIQVQTCSYEQVQRLQEAQASYYRKHAH